MTSPEPQQRTTRFSATNCVDLPSQKIFAKNREFRKLRFCLPSFSSVSTNFWILSARAGSLPPEITSTRETFIKFDENSLRNKSTKLHFNMIYNKKQSFPSWIWLKKIRCFLNCFCNFPAHLAPLSVSRLIRENESSSHTSKTVKISNVKENMHI